MLLPIVGLGVVALLFMAGRASAKTESEDGSTPTPEPAEILKPTTGTPATGPLATGTAVLPIADTEEEKQASAEAVDAAQARDWQTATVAALLSGDAGALDAVANLMRQNGATAQAASLEAVANDWRTIAARETAELRATEGQNVPITLEQVKQAEPPPETYDEPDPGLVAARDLAAYLRPLAPWREDRSKVAELQTALGVNPDGKYGPQTAMAVASYGIIPPAPFYWPSDWQAAAAEYKAYLTDRAEADPARADLWLQARAGAVR